MHYEMPGYFRITGISLVNREGVSKVLCETSVDTL